MNAFAIIILAALVLEFSLKLVGSLLNLNSLKPELPSMLQGIYKPEDYRKSQQYLRVTTRFDLVDSGFTLIAAFSFLVFRRLQLVRSGYYKLEIYPASKWSIIHWHVIFCL